MFFDKIYFTEQKHKDRVLATRFLSLHSDFVCKKGNTTNGELDVVLNWLEKTPRQRLTFLSELLTEM